MLAYIHRLPAPAVIVLAGRWATYIRGPINQLAGADGFLAFGPDDTLSENHSLHVFHALLSRTVSQLVELGHTIVVMGQPPEFTRQPVVCVARQWMLEGDVARACGASSQAIQEYLAPVNERAASVAASFDRVQFIDPLPLFCTQGRCSPAISQTLAYRDTDHLNPRGAVVVGKYLQPFLASYFRTEAQLKQ